MHIEKDVDLYSYSTMRTHSRCDVMYFPENTDELISLLKQLGGECYFLGAGSNVVFASMVRKPGLHNKTVEKKQLLPCYIGL